MQKMTMPQGSKIDSFLAANCAANKTETIIFSLSKRFCN